MKIWPHLFVALMTVACCPQPISANELGTAVAATLTAFPTATLPPTSPPEPSPFPTKQIHSESFAAELDPGLPGSITYSDLGITSKLDFPAGSTKSPVTVNLIAELASSPDTGLLPTGHAFVLLVLQAGQLDKGFSFQVPVTITTNYAEGALGSETSVQLLWWSGEAWRDPGSNCTPPTEAVWDPDINTVRASTCFPGAFALFTSP